MNSSSLKLCKDIQQMYMGAISGVKPLNLIRQTITIDTSKHTAHISNQTYNLNRDVYVIGFGKGVIGMAVGLHQMMRQYITRCLLSVPIGTTGQLACRFDGAELFLNDPKIKIMEGASGNLPDEAALASAVAIHQLVCDAGKDDLIISLVSGGGSALLPLPVDGISLNDKKQAIEALMKSGASISELNIVRQQLSKVKGGKLAMSARPAQMVNLILSDIIGDPLEYIASGPTVIQSLDHQLLLNVIDKYITQGRVPLPEPVTKILKQSGPPESGTDLVDSVHNVLIGSNTMATRGARDVAKQLGYNPVVWSHSIQGEAKEIGEFYAKIVSSYTSNGNLDRLAEGSPSLIPVNDIKCLIDYLKQCEGDVCIISGGEPTVTVRGDGVGGRNQELALSFAKHAGGVQRHVMFCSIGTDGQDGPTDAAGAMADNMTWELAIGEGYDPQSSLDNNDSYNLLSNLCSGKYLVKTSLTGTNVMDIHILIIKASN